jgi:hypothetical protein
MRRATKIALGSASILLLTYSALLVGFYVSMCQSPDLFSTVMSKTPGFLFMVVPFKPMWLHARAGKLKVGDQAPDFSLETYDKQSTVRLSASRGQRPVILVFGSYT